MHLLASQQQKNAIAAGSIASAHEDGNQIVLQIGDAEPLPLPTIWLRDNCVCPECRIELTGEHRYFLGRADSLPQATSVHASNGALEVSWSDGHQSRFSRDDLAGILHITERTHVQARLWADDFQPERFSYGDVVNDSATRLEFMHASMRDGMTLVTDMTNESGECIRFLEQLKLPVRDTPFDRLHDVFFRADGYNVAHTDEALPPHNDFASYTWPPSGQLIHMLVNDVQGGNWVNVDGFKVLAKLWKTDRQAVQVLSQVPVAFREHADYAESWTRAPIVRTDGQGNIIGLRFSNQLMQPMSPFEPRVNEFYEAYHLLAQTINDHANQLELRGDAGLMQVLHGHRILHARRAFDSSTGDRHLQDTYFDFDDLAALAAFTSGDAR